MRTSQTAPTTPSGAASESIRRDLKNRLLALNFHAFARCLMLLLTRMGYEDVQLAGRTNWKGRNRHGGYDIEATLPLPLGLGKRRVIVQVKQYDDALPVYQRSLDELRGTCLRVGASEALLITTSAFAASVEHMRAVPARHFDPIIAPVRLMDGDALIQRMLAYRVGTWEEPGQTSNEPSRFAVDAAFFEELSQAHEGNSRNDCLQEESEAPQVLVTVQVQQGRRPTLRKRCSPRQQRPVSRSPRSR